ncbi:hypothetical protein DRO54_03210 [Candidatus Bathyarchaeota archaeon]|nr:MAG: hypothetical protein DRO54_03210 [Candidatus Bathyarchaeota archaeon]
MSEEPTQEVEVPQAVEAEVSPPEEQETEETTQFYQASDFLEEAESLDEKDVEKFKEIEKKLQDILKMIEEETMQLSEFIMEEKNLTNESCTLLRGILKKLKISFKLPAKAVKLPKKPKEVILNEEGHLILVFEKGEVISKLLEEYPPETVMSVIWEILPGLAKSIKIYREKISSRVSFFEKVKRELRNVFKIFSSSEAKESEDEYEKDIKEAINE